MDRYERREEVKDGIEYETLCRQHDQDDVDELVELITEALCSTRPTIRIGGEDIPAEQVKSRFLTLNCEHINYVFESMARNSTDKKPPVSGPEKKPGPVANGGKKPSGPTPGGNGKKPPVPKPKKSGPAR